MCSGRQPGIAAEEGVKPEVTVFGVQVQRTVLQPRTAGQADVAIDAIELVVFENDVDDTACPFRIIFGAGARDDLDAFDLAGGNGLKGIGKIVTKNARWPAIYQDRIFVLPMMSTFPSTSTETMGTFFNTSVATPPSEVTSFSTL